MRGWLITLMVAIAATLALVALIGAGAAAATGTAAMKCGPGTPNPYCEKPPPCRGHKCQALAGNQIVTYSTRR